MPNALHTYITAGLFAVLVLGSAPAFADPCDDLASSPYDTTRPAGIKGVEPDKIDVAKALPACTAAYELAKDDPRIGFQLGRVLLASGDAAKSKALFETAMKAGHAAAAVNYGAAVEDTDPKAAFDAYTMAAEAGNALGQYNLGVAYKDGIGTEPDGKKAIEWTTKSAEQGDPWAAYNLAVIFDEADLTPRDMPKAVAYYRKAIEGGVVDAMVNLAFVLEKGDGVPVDREGAILLFEQAAATGDVEAKSNFDRLKAAN